MTNAAVLSAAWKTDPVFQTLAKCLYGDDVSQDVILRDLNRADEIVKSDPSPSDLHLLEALPPKRRKKPEEVGKVADDEIFRLISAADDLDMANEAVVRPFRPKPRKKSKPRFTVHKAELLVFTKSYVDAVQAAREAGIISEDGEIISKAQARDELGRFTSGGTSGDYPYPGEGIDHPLYSGMPRSAKIALGLAGAGALGIGAALAGGRAIGGVRGAALGMNVWRKMLKSADPVERAMARAIGPEIIRANTKTLVGAVPAAGVGGLFGAKAGELSRQVAHELDETKSSIKSKMPRNKSNGDFGTEMGATAGALTGTIAGGEIGARLGHPAAAAAGTLLGGIAGIGVGAAVGSAATHRNKKERVKKDWTKFNEERKRKAQMAGGLVAGAAAGQGAYQAAGYGPRTVSRYVYNHDSDSRAYRQRKNQLLGKTPLRGVREANQKIMSPAQRDKRVKAAFEDIARTKRNEARWRALGPEGRLAYGDALSAGWTKDLTDAEKLRLRQTAERIKNMPDPGDSVRLRRADLYRAMPKEIPGAKVERILAQTHGGKTGMAIGAAATLAGAGLAAYALHEHMEDDEKVKKSHEVTWEGEFSKIDEDKRQVFGWASVTEIDGQPVVDLQGDYIHPVEMERAAYDYVLKSRVGGDMHRRDEDRLDGALSKSRPLHVSDLIESFVVTPEKVEKLGLPPGSLPTGWWVGFKVNDESTWQEVKKGNRKGFSIHGLGGRTEKRIEEIDPAYQILSKAYEESENLDEFVANLETISEVTGDEFFKHIGHGIHNHNPKGKLVGGVAGWVGGEELGATAGMAIGTKFGRPRLGRLLGQAVGATVGTTIGGAVGNHVGTKPKRPRKKVARPVRPASITASMGVSKGVSTKNRALAQSKDVGAIRSQAMQEATQAMIPQVAAQVAEIQQQRMLQMQQPMAQNWNVAVGQYANSPSGPSGPQQGPQNYAHG